jgi:hypothetical protein
LVARSLGAAVILDPEWVRELRLGWQDLALLADNAWVIVDLETIVSLAQAAAAGAALVTRRARDEIMSARVECADVTTRGLALFDVLPYSTVGAGEGRDAAEFSIRAIRTGRAWRRWAAAEGLVPGLTSCTPWAERDGDWLSALRAGPRGELIATDLPWLVHGSQGQLLAPRLARRLLAASLGLPLDDALQYWNRSDDLPVLVRDIADLARRYAPLRTLRWASEGGMARLGLCAGDPLAPRRLMAQGGRIDLCGACGGAPAEPMMIFMKWLARELRESTPWARERLADTAFIWQFDTVEGARFATLFDAAPALPAAGERRLALGPLCGGSGVFGDGSFETQAALTGRLRSWVERDE